MNDQVRLIDSPFSEGLETVTALVRCSEFSSDLGKLVRQPGGAERAVLALRREFLPQPQTTVAGNGSDPYRNASGIALPPDHVLVACSYAPLLPMKDLNKVFTGGVSGIYDGRTWRKHASAIVAGEKPGQKVIWLAKPPTELLDDSEKIIAWGDQYRTEVAPNGYRPMMGQHELIDLHRAYPELYLQYWMVALGSFTLDDSDGRVVGVLGARDGKPCLDGSWFDGEWNESFRFPFVSK